MYRIVKQTFKLNSLTKSNSETYRFTLYIQTWEVSDYLLLDAEDGLG